MELSVVVPCYNEEKNIPLLVNRFAEVAKEVDAELVLVDNGSTDGSYRIMADLAKQHDFIKIVTVRENVGYGFGIFSGLSEAEGEYVCWTHADMQTDLNDTIRAHRIIRAQRDPKRSFVKGSRKGRPLFDRFFTAGMSLFETIVLRSRLTEINAQPNLFHRSFLNLLEDPPKDFSFDLFCYYIAKRNNYDIIRFDVDFTPRLHGKSSWNTGLAAKWKFIKRTVDFTFRMKKKIRTPGLFEAYRPKHYENRLGHEGDVAGARENYYKYKPSNLAFLFKKRYEWMNDYIRPGDQVLEVGCGTGISRDFIRNDANVLLTDFADNPWLDKKVDALDTKFPDDKFDVVYCSNMIHHVPFPKKFFREMHRILKPGGFLLIQDINASVAMRTILRAMRHEGWDYTADVFSTDIPCTDRNDLWSANCAISSVLFRNHKKFSEEVDYFDLKSDRYSEFIIFPLSGGVIAKAKTVNLPFYVLRMVDKIDSIFVRTLPEFFAMQRQVVLQKR